MSDADHSALGQALGYLYQFERATYRLLEADSNVIAVGLEHLDDVSVKRADGTTIREQDKATVIDGGRPLADRSVSLWKTLAIWAEAVSDDPAVLAYTEFHLVTNGAVSSNSLAARIHSAKTPPAMTSSATELLTMTTDLRKDLRPFAAKIIKVPRTILESLVGKIFVFDRMAASYGGKLEDLQSFRFLGDLQRRAVFDHATAWVRRTVIAAAQESKPALVDRKAFDHEVKALFRRVAVAPLAMVFETQDSAVDPGHYRSHGFFQQLDWIDLDSGFVRDCVIHYVQARAARVKWTDADAISEASLLAYEEDLKTRWKLQVLRQAHRTYPNEAAQGQERLIDTLSEDTSLDGQPMPKVITCGSFHALADFDAANGPRIGWHPGFEEMVKNARGQS